MLNDQYSITPEADALGRMSNEEQRKRVKSLAKETIPKLGFRSL
jgi:hypothetical protein